jgi:tetratricopeptide (TPR) repeat protein
VRRRCWSTALVVCLPLAATAQSIDGEFRPFVNTGRLVALTALAQERLTKDPADEVALWYLGRHGSPDTRRRDELLLLGEQCVQRNPQSSRCHNVLGHLYGAKAVAAGLSGGLKYAGKVKEAFAAAVELEPQRYEFRRDMNQFYLQAPAIVGGSVRKAAEASAEFRRHSPAHSSLLLADVHVYKKEFERAEALITGVAPGADDALRADVDLTLRALGFALLSAGEAGRAEKLFERQVAINGGMGMAHLGLGRAQLELKKIDAAVVSFERALALDPNLPVQYRLGLAFQARGERAKALSAFRLYLAKHPQGTSADEARRQIEVLERG